MPIFACVPIMLITFLVFAVFFLAYSNGANDNFKGVASLFGSQSWPGLRRQFGHRPARHHRQVSWPPREHHPCQRRLAPRNWDRNPASQVGPRLESSALLGANPSLRHSVISANLFHRTALALTLFFSSLRNRSGISHLL